MFRNNCFVITRKQLAKIRKYIFHDYKKTKSEKDLTAVDIIMKDVQHT